MASQKRAILERALLLIHTVGTGAATAVLAIWPAAIPAVTGVQLRSEQFIVCYFLAGSEAALCFMCIQALRSSLRYLRVMTFQVLIVLHVFTAVLSALWVLHHGANLVVIVNVGFRAVLVLLLTLVIISRLSCDGERIQS